MPITRPSFSSMWANFITIYGKGDIIDVGNMVGGKVKQNINLGVQDSKLGFTNTCAICMSYALNNSGVIVSKGIWSTVSGKNKK